jgi:hypothetical protein
MWVCTCVVLHMLIGWTEGGFEDLTFLDAADGEADVEDFLGDEDFFPPSLDDEVAHETPGWTFRHHLHDHSILHGLIHVN